MLALEETLASCLIDGETEILQSLMIQPRLDGGRLRAQHPHIVSCSSLDLLSPWALSSCCIIKGA